MARLGPIINPTPDPSVVPGAAVLTHIMNGIAWFALAGCLAAVLFGGLAWATASHGGNYSWAERGKKGVLTGMVGAIIVGGAYAFVSTAFGIGSQISSGS